MVDRKKCKFKNVWNRDRNQIEKRIVIDECESGGCVAVHHKDEALFLSGHAYRGVSWAHHAEIIEVKSSRCEAVFYCNHSTTEKCVYFKDSRYGENLLCEFAIFDCNCEITCHSAVARVNRMTLLMKEITK